MTWWPGWDSIEGANTWGHFWFWFGIGCLFLLGISEIVAFRYGLRKDALVAAAQQTSAVEAQQNQDTLQKKLDEAGKKLAEVEKQQAPWRLSDAQKQTLVEVISPSRGQKVSIWCLMGGGESYEMARDFVEIFQTAGWDYGGGTGMTQVNAGLEPGIKAIISQIDGAAGRAPTGVALLLMKLIEFGIIREAFNDPSVPAGTLRLQIGNKPPR
jgi:hypothetical protein